MVGKNTLHICQREMELAVEFYLNQIVLKQPVNVSSVKKSDSMIIPGFDIEFSESMEITTS